MLLRLYTLLRKVETVIQRRLNLAVLATTEVVRLVLGICTAFELEQRLDLNGGGSGASALESLAKATAASHYIRVMTRAALAARSAPTFAF